MCADASSVPNTPDVGTRNDLYESPRFNVSDFNEARIKEEDVGSVECNTFCSAFPLYGSYCSARVAMLVNIEAKF